MFSGEDSNKHFWFKMPKKDVGWSTIKRFSTEVVGLLLKSTIIMKDKDPKDRDCPVFCTDCKALNVLGYTNKPVVATREYKQLKRLLHFSLINALSSANTCRLTESFYLSCIKKHLSALMSASQIYCGMSPVWQLNISDGCSQMGSAGKAWP